MAYLGNPINNIYQVMIFLVVKYIFRKFIFGICFMNIVLGTGNKDLFVPSLVLGTMERQGSVALTSCPQGVAQYIY